MMELGPIAFAAPLALLGLLSLPIIWWLLRLTPPLPRRLVFPPVRLLMRLRQTEDTPRTTPLWLILLRMLLATLIVLGLARPLLNPKADFQGSGPLLLVVDDGWTAASGWPLRRTALEDAIRQAERDGRAVALLATAPPANGARISVGKLATAGDVLPAVLALEPKPWPVDRLAAARAIAGMSWPGDGQVIWLSDGLADPGDDAFASALAGKGAVTVLLPQADDLAIALRPPVVSANGFELSLARAGGDALRTLWVRAAGPRGRLLGRERVTFGAGEATARAGMRLSSAGRNAAVRLEIEGHAAAGAVVLLDERWRRRPVGLVSGAALEDQAQPLLASHYYLTKALAPFSDVRLGDVARLLASPLAVLVMADIGRIPKEDRALLDPWIEAGGTLVRFAGPRLATNADDLIPVDLRRGGRALDGALSWAQPAELAPFDESSPFHGLSLPKDVRVRRQVLAQPSLDLNRRTWARLTDGTPLVTAAARGQGRVVLFHTTANADWSDLALSGLFVDMLRRVAASARGIAGDERGRTLPPLASLDGFGHLGNPAPAATSLAAEAIATTPPGPRHPAGFYGVEEARRALNVTNDRTQLAALGELGIDAARAGYVREAERDLMPWLLAAAVLLALADAIATLAVRGRLWPRRLRRRTAATATGLGLIAGLAGLAGPPEARAQDDAETFALQATLETRLAYVLTGSPTIDSLSRSGLIGLSEVLRRRSSVEPSAPLPVEIERDELVFFPLLYWPIVPQQPRLSTRAIARLDTYLRTGGTILFDTRDTPEGGGAISGATTPAGSRLRALLGRLDVPPLVPVPQQHVLTKAFYLMHSFPGRFAGGRVWVELRPGGINDGVSSVIIGSNDWAAAWAVDSRGRPRAAVVPGGPRQREMAYRFGVNLVMYTLTGNYKADQVHVPAILERLGQ